MGHSRIRGTIKGRAFREITALFQHNADSSTIALKVLQAAHEDLNYERLLNDVGYQEAIKLIVKFGLAAQSKDFITYLKNLGLNISNRPSIEEIKAEAMEYVEKSCFGLPYTDLMEISINALGTAIQSAVDKEHDGLLWSPTSEDYISALAKLSQADNYAHLGQVFFSEIMYHELQKYISRQITTSIGVQDRMKTLNQIQTFDKELHNYCFENAKVVKSFCVDWLGLHEHHLKDVDKKIKDFATYGMEKIFKAMNYYEEEQ